MATAFQLNTFQNNAFQIVVAAATTAKGDGKRKPWYQRIEVSKEDVDARAKLYRLKREKLHEDIRFAMDGSIEEPVLDVIRSELEPEDYAQFGAEDYEPQLKSLLSQTEALRTIARLVLEEHARLEMEDEEESILLLLQ